MLLVDKAALRDHLPLEGLIDDASLLDIGDEPRHLALGGVGHEIAYVEGSGQHGEQHQEHPPHGAPPAAASPTGPGGRVGGHPRGAVEVEVPLSLLAGRVGSVRDGGVSGAGLRG